MPQSTLEITVGALIAILTTITVEWLRKPRLSLRVVPHHDNSYQNRPAKQVRFLALELNNQNLPWFARWMSRSAALHTRGGLPSITWTARIFLAGR